MIKSIREQWALFVIALGAIYGVWAFYTQPALLERRAAESELIAATGMRIEFASQPDADDPAQNGPTLRSMLEICFGDGDLLGEQNLLNTIAAESDVQIVRIDPSGQSESTGFGPILLEGNSLKLEASGAYSDIARFLSVLSSTQASVIEALSLDVSGQGGSVDVTLQLSTVSVVRRSGAVADGEIE